MNNFMKILFLFLFVSGTIVQAQNVNRIKENDYRNDPVRKIIRIPDIPGYMTLKGDFHMHTIFSDGYVWPDLRVMEAWAEGLDIIAITDHVEYHPHKAYIQDDLNTSYDIALSRAEQMNILLVKATEITRQMPGGHFNALFIKDANLIAESDSMLQLKLAAEQGGFIMWNHPGWEAQQPDTTIWLDFHTEALNNGWLHGVEAANGGEWYPIVLDWCKEKNLAVFANSDNHLPLNTQYNLSLPNSHRPMTLVFAKERSLDAVKDALFEKRTVGFQGNKLLGREDLIIALFNASVNLNTPYLTTKVRGTEYHIAELENNSDLTFILEKQEGKGWPEHLELLPGSVVTVRYPSDQVSASYRLVNCHSGSDSHPEISF